jgi:hypothetical protein
VTVFRTIHRNTHRGYRHDRHSLCAEKEDGVARITDSERSIELSGAWSWPRFDSPSIDPDGPAFG